MVHRFGEFELDEERRELRLQGRELMLQPLVFDFLAYLMTHRDRVVTKDELLGKLWPDVVVADGALQRVVSLARSALREGGLADSIRTHARLGYRFCGELETRHESPASPPLGRSLEQAREAFEQSRWLAASAAFALADQQSALCAADLERWAQAAKSAGMLAEAAAPLERAAAAHASAGDRRGAARAALQLAQVQFERRDVAVANGWRNRAASFLEGVEPSAEHGLLAFVTGRWAFLRGELQRSAEQMEVAIELGRRFEDADIEALGLVYSGLAKYTLGQTEQGLARQDEGAATVLGGGVSPWAGGIVYCAVIWGAAMRADWGRAAQWTEHFTRWCERNGTPAFSGMCRAHRAELLLVKGELRQAEAEAHEVQQLLSSSPADEGQAWRVLGEVHLARGQLDQADAAFRRAHELGWDPQPGWALLQLKQGRADAAIRSLERSLADPGWMDHHRRGQLLSHLVVIARAAGDHQRAESALQELEEHPELWNTPAIRALVCRARAEFALTLGRTSEAVGHLRCALRYWHEVGSPLNAAVLRIQLAECHLAEGDQHAAELELHAAEALADKLGAPDLVDACEALRRVLSSESGTAGASEA